MESSYSSDPRVRRCWLRCAVANLITCRAGNGDWPSSGTWRRASSPSASRATAPTGCSRTSSPRTRHSLRHSVLPHRSPPPTSGAEVDGKDLIGRSMQLVSPIRSGSTLDGRAATGTSSPSPSTRATSGSRASPSPSPRGLNTSRESHHGQMLVTRSLPAEVRP